MTAAALETETTEFLCPDSLGCDWKDDDVGSDEAGGVEEEKLDSLKALKVPGDIA